jgi:transposase-like protein
MATAKITLADLMEKYNCEDKCRAYLEELRWPNGPVCPKCDSKNTMRVGGREEVIRCKDCNAQFTVTTGTIFHDSHLPLAKWFIATCLICEAKKGMSALQLKRLLGTGYKTAWYLTHRIRQAMMNANGAEEQLTGIVEMDETWVGGRNYGGTGSGRENKSCVVGITERGGKLRLMVVEDLTSKSIQKVVKKWVSKDLELIVSDGLSAYVPAIGPIYRHKYTRVNNSQPYLEGQQNTNCIENRFSLLKRGIVGSWHKVSVKHLQRYLEEVSFRFSQRNNPALFSKTLLSLVSSDPLTFKQLTKKKAA